MDKSLEEVSNPYDDEHFSYYCNRVGHARVFCLVDCMSEILLEPRIATCFREKVVMGKP